MEEIINPLSRLSALVAESSWALHRAGLVLGVQTDPRKGPITIRQIDYSIPRTVYDKEVLENAVGWILLSELTLRQKIMQLRRRSSYSAEDLASLADSVYRLALRVQQLSMLSALKPAFETYHRHVYRSRNYAAMRKNLENLGRIVNALEARPKQQINKLTELYAIPGVPASAVDYFLKPNELGNNRCKWLRGNLRRAGYYAGQRGRPRVRKNMASRIA